ncbi:MAG: ABC transporter ATP-binding protein, partial [bacterium]
FKKMSVLENVMISPVNQIGERLTGPFFQNTEMKREEAKIRDRAMQILEFVTLDHLANQAAGKISGGQMKLLELARVLMVSPSMILLDEPAAGVSPTLTELLIDKITELNRQGTTFLIIEHNMDFIMKRCDPVIAMAEGKVIFEGTPAEAQRNPLLLEAYLGAALNG